jgi:hypothetical protein
VLPFTGVVFPAFNDANLANQEQVIIRLDQHRLAPSWVI